MQNQKQNRLFTRYGPWALVTGASSGTGREIVLRLAEAGFNLVLVARTASALSELAAACSNLGVSARTISVDLAQPVSVEEVITQTRELDVGLIVLAAGFGSSGAFIATDLSNELAMLDVNCRCVLTLAWHFGRRFAENKRGGIVLFGSLVGFQGVPNSANYAASKAYVQSLAEALHVELKPQGVDVVATAPGPIYSGFASRANMTFKMGQKPQSVALATLNALGRQMTVRPGWLSKLLEWSLKPLPRWGRVQMMGAIMGGMAKQNGSRSP